jgi:putative ABC transport system ATP-binding protein
MTSAFIDLQNVSKIYPEGTQNHRVLLDVSAQIAKSEIAIILGRSGSGKSTLLNLISGIDQASAGTISVNDTVVTQLTEQEKTLFRRRHIGFIFQFFNLIPTLTTLENLLLPLHLNGIKGAVAHSTALALLDEVKLADRAKSYPDRLSGGEQQRVAIVRALVHQPDIILADEPTGNLDYETGLQVIEFLDKLVRLNGTTMLMVTHSKEVAGLADRILTIKDGKLLQWASSASI